MAEPFIGQIIMFGGNFAPRNWALCQGQLQSISQNTALFSILGTTYGGDGITTFALPDFRGRAPVGIGTGPGLPNVQLGEKAGTPTQTLVSTQLPVHTHTATFSGSASTLSAAQVPSTHQQAQASPQSMLARAVDAAANPVSVPKIYAPATSTPTVPLGGLNVAGTVTNAPAGGNQPFSVMQPYLGMNFIIALYGVFPSRS